MTTITAYLSRLSYIVWAGAMLILATRELSQLGANSVRAQYEIQKQLQAEFIQAIKAAGMEVHEAPAPSIKG